MEAWISLNKNHINNKGQVNYTRFGKAIPDIENKLDVCKYFGVSIERAENIVKQLMSDSRVICKPHKPAGDSQRKVIENIETVIEEKKDIEQKDISEKTNKELKVMLDEKNIEYSNNATKKELLDLLKD